MSTCKYRLEMVRGKRTIFIGEFATKYRVEQIPGLLEWDGSWRPVITDMIAGVKLQRDVIRAPRRKPGVIADEQARLLVQFGKREAYGGY